MLKNKPICPRHKRTQYQHRKTEKQTKTTKTKQQNKIPQTLIKRKKAGKRYTR